MTVELENDPANPCFGCGPANPSGLRLRFVRDGDVVRSSMLAEPRLVGFPDTMHTAFLYLALAETANWTVWGVLGRAGVPQRTGPLETRARVRVGSTVTLEGRLADAAARPIAAGALARVNGEVVAALHRTYALPTREEATAMLPHAVAHPSMQGLFPEG